MNRLLFLNAFTHGLYPYGHPENIAGNSIIRWRETTSDANLEGSQIDHLSHDHQRLLLVKFPQSNQASILHLQGTLRCALPTTHETQVLFEPRTANELTPALVSGSTFASRVQALLPFSSHNRQPNAYHLASTLRSEKDQNTFSNAKNSTDRKKPAN